MNQAQTPDSVIGKSTTGTALLDNAALLDAVKVRKSTRNYDPIPLRENDIESIHRYLDDDVLMTGSFGHAFKLALLTDTVMKDKQQVGTYAMVKNVQAYQVGISGSEPPALFELAYVFHGLILHLTHLGLGTCWMGGSFNHEAIHVGDDEIVLAISPVGMPKGSKHLKERMVRLALGAARRKPMDQVYFFGGFDRPIGDNAQPYRQALDLARLSPSAKNRQPWRVVVSPDLSRVHFYVEFSLKDEVGIGPRKYACPPEHLDIGCHYRTFEIVMMSEGVADSLEINDPRIQPLRSAIMST